MVDFVVNFVVGFVVDFVVGFVVKFLPQNVPQNLPQNRTARAHVKLTVFFNSHMSHESTRYNTGTADIMYRPRTYSNFKLLQARYQ